MDQKSAGCGQYPLRKSRSHLLKLPHSLAIDILLILLLFGPTIFVAIRALQVGRFQATGEPPLSVRSQPSWPTSETNLSNLCDTCKVASIRLCVTATDFKECSQMSIVFNGTLTCVKARDR